MARHYGSGNYATVEVSTEILSRMIKKFPDLEEFRDDLRYRGTVDLTIRMLSIPHMEYLVELLKENGDSGQAGHITGFLNVIRSPREVKVSNLQKAEPAIVQWLRNSAIRGWIFSIDSERPELVTNIEYYESEKDSPAHVRVSTKYISNSSNSGGGFTIYSADIGRTVTEVFMRHGYIHEDKALHAQYDKWDKIYLEWRDQLGRQFLCNGQRIVNDTTGVEKSKRRLFDAEDESDYRGSGEDLVYRANNRVFRKAGDSDDDPTSADAAFTRIPVHHDLYCFDLSTHEFHWHNIQELTPYTYTPALRDRLILPPDHRNLIDALTKDLSIVAEDVVAGKTGGVTILCQGKPGTGKTLTAEVYAEVVSKPLYRVHSGQLGTEAQGLEKVLVLALERANRWDAILLIDEADVFLMQRTDDLMRNAVVGVFLRTLEYYKGILFLTTNRLDAIDDAIISRCIAVIRYENPGPNERRAIWQTQLDLSGIELTEDLIERLANHFEASGRDIKGLVRLTARYCRAHDKQPDFEDFVRMGTFRGL